MLDGTGKRMSEVSATKLEKQYQSFCSTDPLSSSVKKSSTFAKSKKMSKKIAEVTTNGTNIFFTLSPDF